jgi:hypothetical protein
MPVAPMRQATQQPPQWQAPSPAYLASGASAQPLPAKARGVMADLPAVRKFLLPSPESLGVSVSASPPPAAKVQVDWKQIQSRMERLGVLRYKKNALPNGGVGVSMLLQTSDPALGQPVEAQADTEAAAIILALDAAEAWARKR